MKVNIYTAVWGKHHINQFEKGLLWSLNQPKNAEALNGLPWYILTKREQVPELEALLKEKCKFTKDFRFLELPVEQLTPQTEASHGLLHGIIYMIQASLHENSKILLAPPDTVFGESSVPNILLHGERPLTCVAVPHVRVTPNILKEFYDGNVLSNAELVGLSFRDEYLHECWKVSKKDSIKQNTFMSGVLWQRAKDGLISVQHLMPTVYLAHFSQNDLTFFYGVQSFGSWDHNWPGECLIRQHRQRYIASSDMAYLVELTEPEKNIPPEVKFSQPGYRPEQDQFYRDGLHNEMNKLIISTFREE